MSHRRSGPAIDEYYDLAKFSNLAYKLDTLALLQLSANQVAEGTDSTDQQTLANTTHGRFNHRHPGRIRRPNLRESVART